MIRERIGLREGELKFAALKMFTYVGLIAMAIALQISRPPTVSPGHVEHQKSQTNQKTGSNPKLSSSSPTERETEAKTSNSEKNAAREPSYWMRAFSPESLPNWWLALVGTAGTIAAIWTICLLIRQTRAT